MSDSEFAKELAFLAAAKLYELGRLSWDGVPSVRYDERRLPGADQLDELFKQRRTTRAYKEQPVERALLVEIAAYGIYAPTNHYHLRALLIDDPRVLDRVQAYGLRALKRIYHLFYRPKLVFDLLRRLTPAMQGKDKVKLEAGLERGKAFTVAPALIVVAGNATIAHAEASAHYALYNMILAAQVRGLGSTISGGIRLGWNVHSRKPPRNTVSRELGESSFRQD